MKKICALIIAVFLLSTGYCYGLYAGSRPTEEDTLKVFQNSKSKWVKTIDNVKYWTVSWDSLIKSGIVKLIDFKVTDADSYEKDGIRYRSISFEAAIENLKGDGNKIEGTKYKLKGKVLFKKFEEGWAPISEATYTEEALD